MQISYRDHHLEKLANWIGDHKYPEWIGKKYRAVLHEIEKMQNVKEILQKIWWYAERKKWDRSDQIGIHLNKWRRLMIKVEWNIVNIILVREITNHYE